VDVEQKPPQPSEFPKLGDRQKTSKIGDSTVADLANLIDPCSGEKLMHLIEERYKARQTSNITEGLKLVPGVAVEGKIILLPDTTITKPDNLLLAAMALLATNLGYQVKQIDYGERAIKTLTEAQWQTAAGISFATLDLGRHLNIKGKKDHYEYGRTIARAQQTLGLFSQTEWLGLEALRRSHRWFGNNPNEKEGEGRQRLPVVYTAKEFESYFIEKEWAKELAILLGVLLRKSASLLDKKVQRSTIEDNILGFSEAVALYQSCRVTTVPAQGKKPAVTVEKVPHKPKSNSLLTKEEMEFVSSAISSLFTAIDPGDKTQWVNQIEESKFSFVKSKLKTNANMRATWLTRFASITTKRLNEVRNNLANKNKRKKEVTSTEVISMLLRRPAPLAKFAEEVASTDPGFVTALAGYKRHNVNGEIDLTKSRAALYDDVVAKVSPGYTRHDIKAHIPAEDIPRVAVKETQAREANLDSVVREYTMNTAHPSWIRAHVKLVHDAKRILSPGALDKLTKALLGNHNKNKDKLLGDDQLRKIATKITDEVLGPPKGGTSSW
jgi:hypothetical protein